MRLDTMLAGVKRLAISGHVRPDGDCTGSCMGLYHYIKDNYPEVKAHVYLEEIPESFAFLDASDEIRHEAGNEEPYDLFFAMDCGDSRRLGFAEEIFHSAARTVCVDHHISNGGFADQNYIEPSGSSTSELIYNFMEPDRISRAAASWLYLGIIHDTGVFRYTAAKPSTMEAAAVLMKKGIDASAIIEHTYYDKTYNQMQMLGHVLLNSRLYLEGRCIAASISLEEQKKFGVTPLSLDGIASQLKSTRGVDVVIFLYELKQDTDSARQYKVSLRSGPAVDVSQIALTYGGGGHKKAAGFQTEKSPEEMIQAVIDLATAQMNEG